MINEIQIGDLDRLWWLWAVPVCLLVIAFALMRIQRARLRFATRNLHQRLPKVGWLRRMFAGLLACAAFALLLVALADIRWGKTWREVPQRGIELMFVLDVSRSMLAEDLKPNRLERAKQQITDMLEEMAGDRAGLVVFAGEARQVIPMTSHYDDFLQRLQTIGPHSVRTGGSNLANAISSAASGFLAKTGEHRAMVIITDGGDDASEPVEVARREFENNGVRVFTIGLGDESQGARIPSDEQRRRAYVEYQGEQVWSKQNREVLTAIAEASEGAFIPVGTKNIDMGAVYRKYVADVEDKQFETAKINSYEARFQWFLAPALVLLLAEVMVTNWSKMIRTRTATQKEQSNRPTKPTINSQPATPAANEEVAL